MNEPNPHAADRPLPEPHGDRRSRAPRRAFDVACLGATDVLERMTDAFFAFDGAWRIAYVNGRGEALVGRPRGALLGRHARDVFPESVVGRLRDEYGAGAAGGSQAPVEYEAYHAPLGIWVEIRAFPFDDGCAVYAHDVTERKRAEVALRESEARLAIDVTERRRTEEALRLSEARFRAALKNSPVVVFNQDRQLRYTWIHNPALGWRAEQVVGRSDQDLFERREDAERIIAIKRRVLESGLGTREEVPIHSRGVARHFDLTVEPLRDADGRVAGVTCAAVDVTERRHAEDDRAHLLAAEQRARAEAERARADAEAANAAKSQFLATMSHEIRTPINAILGYADLLDLGVVGPVTTQQRDYLGRLRASGHHLLALVNDVLDLSKIDAGRMPVAVEPGTTGAAVESALTLIRPQAEAKGVRLADAQAGGAGVPYVGDEDRVRQILVNLLSNAVKFTEPGGSVTVDATQATEAAPEARVRGAGPWARVDVEDTGAGIAAEHHAAIFDPFHQLDGGHTRRAGGTGLGLAISRRLARMMGGDITVRSAPERGSCFTLWLPAVASSRGGSRASEAQQDAGEPLPIGGRGHAVAGVGDALREELDAILASYAARLRVDPGTTAAREMRPAQLEDHHLTLLGDFAQSLVIIGDAAEEAAALLRDGSAIQRVVAEHHGRRRQAQGWDERAVRRGYQILREEVERAVRGHAAVAGAADAGAVEEALGALFGMMQRAEDVSVRAWRSASRVQEP